MMPPSHEICKREGPDYNTSQEG